MKVTLLIFTFFIICVTNSAAHSQTLESLFSHAKKNAGGPTEWKNNIKIAQAQKSEAAASFLPSLSVTSQNVWQEQADVGAFGEPHQHTAYLSLTQPLFQGGGEYYGWAMAKRLPNIARLKQAQGEIELYTNIAIAFYETLGLESEREILRDQKKALTERVATLSQRARIGRNKITDVLAARSQLARVTADLVQIDAQIVAAIKNLKNLSGHPEISQLSDNLDLSDLNINKEWGINLMNTPMIRAQEITLENYKSEIGIAESGFYPEVDVEGRYYIDRSGILSESDWGITLNATWEIFSGGKDISEKRQKTFEMKTIEARLVERKKQLINDFQSLAKEFVIQKETIEKLSTAVDLAKENYREHLKEANRGLVNQLDVLRALEEYLNVRRSYEQQTFTTKKTWIYLRALAGVRP